MRCEWRRTSWQPRSADAPTASSGGVSAMNSWSRRSSPAASTAIARCQSAARCARVCRDPSRLSRRSRSARDRRRSVRSSWLSVGCSAVGIVLRTGQGSARPWRCTLDRHVAPPRHPDQSPRGARYVRGKRALDRRPRHRLAHQHLYGRVDVLGPHRLALIGQHLDDGLEHPARPADSLPADHGRPPRPATGPHGGLEWWSGPGFVDSCGL